MEPLEWEVLVFMVVLVGLVLLKHALDYRRRPEFCVHQVAAFQAVAEAVAAGEVGPPPGPVPLAARCLGCSAVGAFHVAKVRQHDDENGGDWPIAIHCQVLCEFLECRGYRLDAGHLEAVLCSACGLLTWYAVDANGPLRAISVLYDGCAETSDPCPCGSDRAWTIQRPRWPGPDPGSVTVELCFTYELDRRRTKALGRLTATVCQGCGRVRLECPEPAVVGASGTPGLQAIQASCARCPSQGAWQHESVHYRSLNYANLQLPLAVTAVRARKMQQQQVGRVAAHLCAGCGLVTWTARDANDDLAALAAVHDSGVRRI